MGDLINWMKEMYMHCKNRDFEWLNLYPNNMPSNGLEGYYTYFYVKNSQGLYDLVKFTINFQSRCDKNGISHPEEGVKYYNLYKLVVHDLDENKKIPEPSDDFSDKQKKGYLKATTVNVFGDFRYAFDDIETAKAVAYQELVNTLYPYTYILDEFEQDEWEAFVRENPLNFEEDD